jgi:AraC family transcriptional regulator of arabinose operon
MKISTGASDNPLDHTFTREPGFPFWTLGILSTGSSYVLFGEEEILRIAPHLMLVPPDTPYSLRHGGRGRRWVGKWAIFSSSPRLQGLLRLPPVCGRAMGCPRISKEQAHDLNRAFDDLLRFDSGSHLLREQLLENTLERILLLANEISAMESDALDPRVRRAMKILSSDLAEDISLQEVAEQTHASLSSLAHLFSEQVGVSPMRFRETQRMRRAKHLLLTTNLPVKTVAPRIGYRNAFHFSRRFRQHCGLSPSKYRTRPDRAR